MLAALAARPPAEPTLFGVPAPDINTDHATCRWDGRRRVWVVRLTTKGRAFADAFVAKYPRPEAVLRKVSARAWHALIPHAREDLHAAANFAVTRAAASWVPGKGESFSTYAGHAVHKAACDLIDRQTRYAETFSPADVTFEDVDPESGRDAEIWAASRDAATVLRRLGKADRWLIRAAFGVGRRRLTLGQIGRVLRVSKATVAKRLARAIAIARAKAAA